jgi:hypothetical protein
MKRKILNHFVDVFCEMFLGWRLSNDDINTLLEYNNGKLKLDFWKNKIYYNNDVISIDLYIFEEIKAWFIQNCDKEKIDTNNILEAYITVGNKTIEEDVKKNSRTKRKIKIDVNIIGYIKTDEKEYKCEKNKIGRWHYQK